MHSEAAERTYFFIRFNAKTLYHLVNIFLCDFAKLNYLCKKINNRHAAYHIV